MQKSPVKIYIASPQYPGLEIGLLNKLAVELLAEGVQNTLTTS